MLGGHLKDSWKTQRDSHSDLNEEAQLVYQELEGS